MEGFLRGEETTIGEGIAHAFVPEAVALYSENEAAGDQRYLGKKLFLAGAIGAIHNDAGDIPYVVFRDTGSLGVRALLSLAGATEVSELKKVQHTALVCIGAGAIDGTVMFKDCLSAVKYASTGGAKFVCSLNAFANGKEVSQAVAFFAVHIESKARTIDDAVSCATACLKLVNEEHAQDRHTLAALVEAMREGGLKIPPQRKRLPTT